jgi:4-amino-4-deoxy-L-arabinose transferase-like glycosyltransferase
VIVLIVIVAVAVTLRALYLHELVGTPDFAHPMCDANYNNYWARGLATGDWSPLAYEPDPMIRSTPFFRPPGYPYLLSFLYRIGGLGYIWPRIAQMCLGVLNIVVAFFFARRYFGRAAALVGSALMASWWVLIYFEGEFQGVVVSILLMMLLAWCLAAWSESMKLMFAAAAGAIAGLGALFRPNSLFLVPFIAAWVIWIHRRRGSLRLSWRTVAVFVALTAALIAPATIRNAVVADDFVPVSYNAGINLFIGNNDRADGLVNGTMPGIGTLDTSFDHEEIFRSVQRKAGRPMKHSEVSSYLAREAMDWIRRHPGRALELVGRKTLIFWGPAETADNKEVTLDRRASRILSRLPLNFPIILSLGVLGLVAFFVDHWPRRREDAGAARDDGRMLELGVLLVLMMFAWYASHMPFIATTRYRLPITPFLMMFGGVFVVRTVGLARERKWRRTGLWVAALVAVLIPAHVDFARYTPSPARWHYQRGLAHSRAGRNAAAVEEFREALKENPEYGAVHNDLGALLAGTGRIRESIPHLREAARLLHDDPAAHFNLAAALEFVGAYQESRAHYMYALRLAPGDAEAAAGLARTTEALGD